MAGFLYYVPTNEPKFGRNDLVKIDFPFYDNAAVPGRHVERAGPDGGMGWIFQLTGQTSLGAKRPTVGFYKDTQEWQCAGQYWIGWEKDAPPAGNGRTQAKPAVAPARGGTSKAAGR